ncbi:MAG: amphi-Trp domain-containing protein [Desulfovermiculus sp.]|nr:amphi-Trp domain-containing protein [Desulfovermiculus sp.]
MAENQDFFHESVQDASTIKDVLQALQDAMEQRRIVLSADEQELVLTPNSLLHMSIKARKKGSSNKLQIKIVWEDRNDADEGRSGRLSIGS